MAMQILKRAVVSAVGRDMVNRLTGPFYDWAAMRRSNRYLQQLDQKHLLVNLGCGPEPFDGWINVDIARGDQVDVVMDARKGLPFRDNSCQAIFCEHVIEHITRDEGIALLRECHRILEPCGVVQISTPDAGKYLQSYAGDPAFLQRAMQHRPAPTPMDRINMVMREGGLHLWLYDAESLMCVFQEAGFEHIAEQQPSTSHCPAMTDLDHPNRKFESVYVEGLRLP